MKKELRRAARSLDCNVQEHRAPPGSELANTGQSAQLQSVLIHTESVRLKLKETTHAEQIKRVLTITGHGE